MAKINRKNVRERIGEMLKDYEVKHADDYDRSKYIEMTESEFDAIVENILNNCTKELRYYLDRYTRKYTIAWLGYAPGARISTYEHDYAFVKFI